VELHKHNFLSAPKLLRRYTYINCPESVAQPIHVTETGTLHGVLSWFMADFNGARAANQPFSGSHWHQAYHPLPQEMRVIKGETVLVSLDDEGFATVVRA
jgi:hypothetical protein